MAKSYDNVLHEIYETPWMILPATLEQIVSIVEKRMHGVQLTEEEMLEIRGGRNTPTQLEMPDTPSVAVLPIQGPIFPKANMMTQMSGATSVDSLQTQFNALMESDMVTGIVLNIDSPGGHASMIKEMADTIYSARGKKPIIAVANPMAASAAYYLGSQADKLYSTNSGMVGSVGVVAMHLDESARDAQDGVNRTILTVGKYKAEANPYEPLSDEAKAFKLEQMQETYDEFVGDVARGRGLDTETVLSDFGQGRAYRAKTALKRGMVDGVETLDSVVGRYSNVEQNNLSVSMHIPKSQEGDDKMELTPETLELLGLTENATAEEIENAIKALSENTTVEAAETTVSEFATMFPEQAAEIARLRQADRKNAAKMFAANYAQFTSENGKTGFGFSSLGLEKVEQLHLQVADGVVTQSDLKEFLDFVASGNSIVDYREVGSTRGEDLTNLDGNESATKLRDLAYAKVAEEGLSYGDALSIVLGENPSLAEAYRNSVASPVERGEG